MPGSGDSKQQTQTSQTMSSQTDPWKPSQGLLTGILGQLSSSLGSTGVTPDQTKAISDYQALAPQYGQYVSSLLGGGGALNEAGKVNQAYSNYFNATNPLASNTNYDPMQTPGIGTQLQSLTDNITQNVNGSFAAAGRDFSGYNQKALGQGLAAGLAPVLTSQYNQNVSNQQGAARDLYNAGNANAGLLSGFQRQFLENQGRGVTSAAEVLGGRLGAGSAGLGTTLQNLGLLANIGIPIAGLGGTSSGTSTGTSNTTYKPSTVDTFGKWLNVGGQAMGTAAKAASFISDRNAKEDIAQVGTLFDGTPVYRFRYIGDPRFQIGLMAQDIEKTTPEAVGQIGQWKAVDYKLATDKALEVA